MPEKRFSAAIIQSQIENHFVAAGFQPQHAKVMANSLVETSLRGVDSHGIRLTPHYVKAVIAGRINKNPNFKFENTAPAVSVMDADNGHGIIAGLAAMERAVENARRAGIGAVSVKNSSHFAAAAIYCLAAAKQDMVGMCFTHAEAMMAPHGGSKGFFGTNPICFAAPCEGEEPFCLDMATSAITRNRVLYSRENNLKIPNGHALDKNGANTTDPHEVNCLLPFGSHKGSGLASMVEIFSSIFSGMAFGPFVAPMLPVSGNPRKLGQFFMAIDIKCFQSVPVFKCRLKEMMELLRNQPPAQGFEKVLVAGDPEKNCRVERSEKGIPVGEELLRSLDTLCETLKIENLLTQSITA